MQFNKVFFGGHLTRDPELHHTQGGRAYVKFGVACNESWGKGDEKKTKVTFVDFTAWGRIAEVIAEHFHKGKLIFVEGRLHYSSWESDAGKRSKIEIVVETFKFTGPRADGEEKPSAKGGGEVDYGDTPF